MCNAQKWNFWRKALFLCCLILRVTVMTTGSFFFSGVCKSASLLLIKSVWLLMVTWQSQTLWKLCSHRTSSCTETENILAAVCHIWLSPPGVGPLVRMDVPSTVFRGWFLCWRPSASWLLSPGTDITSTAPVSTAFSPRYSFFVLFFLET